MTACAAAFVLLAIVRYSVGRRGAPAGGLVAATLLMLSLALPLVARGAGEAPRAAAHGGARRRFRWSNPSRRRECG